MNKRTYGYIKRSNSDIIFAIAMVFVVLLVGQITIAIQINQFLN